MGASLIIGILLFCCILLVIKIYFMRNSINEIEKSLNFIIKSDTNNIISISSADKYIKNLAINLNRKLVDLRDCRLQYENGNQELKKIITNISHDLRTPLTAIKGYIDLMNEEQLSKNQKQYLNIMKKKSNELTELTEQLFDFSKAVDVDISIKKEKYCINEILEEVLISYYSISKEKNIIPEIQICKEKIYKIVDRNSLIRIFENVLSNIFKYSNGNFKVELKKDGIITFSNKATSLDATTVQKIFNRYFSVENAKESTGIGLSIAKQLVELNNGNIYADYMNETLYISMKFNHEK